MKIVKKLLLSCIFIVLLYVAYLGYQKISFDNKARNLNLILISVDTLRADHMGIYGYSKNTTPNIDAWAKDAYIFSKAYTVFPMTYPSFAALFTGKYPTTLGIYNHEGVTTNIKEDYIDDPKKDNIITFPMILKQYDYKNVAFVTNIAVSNQYTILGRGFDTYRVMGDANYKKHNRRIIEWLEQNKNNKFFLWIHLMNPHLPYYPPEDYKCKFNKGYCQTLQNESENVLQEEAYQIRTFSNDFCNDAKKINGSSLEKYKTLYDGEVAFADDLIGEILNEIKSLNLDSKSVVIVHSDHGEGFDHNYYFDHTRALYESQVHIPLIIKYPGAAAVNKDVKSLIANIDIMPTILDLLGIPQTKKTDGTSFSNLFMSKNNTVFDKENKERTIFLADTGLEKFGLIKGDYKYITSQNKCEPLVTKEYFYDLDKDNKESINLITKNNSDLIKEANKYKTALLKMIPQLVVTTKKNPTKEVETNTEKNSVLEKLKSLGY